jgi:similar to stage IV sporulation protein
MFIIQMLRYIQGYVRFRVTGGFAERFISLCARAGIPIWGVRPRDDYDIEAHTLARNYKRLRPLRRKGGVRMHIEAKVGLPFVVHRYRQRWGILVAAVLFALLLFGLSCFIWRIEIPETEGVSTEEIRAQLSSLGVRVGAWRGSIDPKEAARRMMILNDDIAWIALNILGSTIEVEISPRTQPPDRIHDAKVPTNVVAAHTGQIKYMEVYDGESLLGVGDTVMEGDIIVSGITQDKWGNTMLHHARARVLAWTDETIEVSCPLMAEERVYTEQPMVRRGLLIAEMELPLSLKKPPALYEEETERAYLRLMGRELPVGLTVRTLRPYTLKTVRLTQAEARLRAMAELKALEESRFGEMKVVDRMAIGQLESDAFVIRARYTVERDIAEVRQIFMAD